MLVTGGAGYIGSHAAKALHRAGYRVVVYDNLLAGHREAVRFGEFVEGDVADLALLRHTLRRFAVGAVMHFAALLAVSESVRDPIRYYRTNVSGALTVLEAMAAESVGRFVFSSTCAVYGEPVETPIDEAQPTRPINTYGETKLAVERALPHYERAFGLRFAALRYFNAAGADPDGELGEDHDPEIHLIPRAIQAATGGAPLEIFGDDYPTPDGTCLRDYVHVTDLADAHVLALQALEETGRSDTCNLGSGRPSSVREVTAMVERVTGLPVPARLAARREGDPAVLFAASRRAAAELHWRPRHSGLETIVRTAWQWHRAHPHGFRGGELA
ncbi:MAG TPA: UDP-glucose 4-epimerase GalE [Vicinamibacterales bacterium]|nr:UDP-glucose 4-epimerase GalE [Vicinamibacterales bacterium]